MILVVGKFFQGLSERVSHSTGSGPELSLVEGMQGQSSEETGLSAIAGR